MPSLYLNTSQHCLQQRLIAYVDDHNIYLRPTHDFHNGDIITYEWKCVSPRRYTPRGWLSGSNQLIIALILIRLTTFATVSLHSRMNV